MKLPSIISDNMVLQRDVPVKIQLRANGDIQVYFSHAQGLCTSGSEPVRGFAVAGKDGVLVDCPAVIDGKSVVLQCSNIESPSEGNPSVTGAEMARHEVAPYVGPQLAEAIGIDTPT